jgi:FAD/FMN-containing dehydrogenase
MAFQLLATCFLIYGVSGLSWSNWDGRQSCNPAVIVNASSEADILGALQQAHSLKTTLKVAGDGHSFSPIVLTDGVLLVLDMFNQVVGESEDTVEVQSGMHLHEINSYLFAKGKALRNLGAISMQTIAGETRIRFFSFMNAALHCFSLFFSLAFFLSFA